MSYVNSWRKDDWIAECDRCGFRYKASQLKKTWDGLYVCAKDFEERHELDFVKSVPDKQSVPWTRGEGPDKQPGVVSLGAVSPMGSGNGGAVTASTVNANLYVTGPWKVAGSAGDPAFQRYNTSQGVFETYLYKPASSEIEMTYTNLGYGEEGYFEFDG